MTDHEIDVLAKQLSRPNYLQLISVTILFVLALAGIGYLTVVIPQNLQKHLENIIGVQQ